MLYSLKKLTQAYTFEEVIQSVMHSTTRTSTETPDHFWFMGDSFTKIHNELYLIDGRTEFTPNEMVVVNKMDDEPRNLVVYDKETFLDLYSPSLASLQQNIRDSMDKLKGENNEKV